MIRSNIIRPNTAEYLQQGHIVGIIFFVNMDQAEDFGRGGRVAG